MYGVRHEGMPEGCPVCFPLPVDFGERQEAIWQHAVSQFVDQSGVDASALSRADLIPLVRSWAVANRVAVIERRLFGESTDPRSPEVERFTRWSYRLAVSLFFAVLVCLLLVCAGVWRFFS